MHPILFKIGSLTFYTYGLIMAAAFIIAYFYLLHLARISGQDEEFYSNFFFWIMVTGILGAKGLYLLVDWRNILNTVKDVVGCIRGGLVWYGGMIAVLVFGYFYARKYKKNYGRVADTIAVPAIVGLGIGRWGCLMAGCCYGKPSSLPWAITYPSLPIPHQLAGIPVHPSPIYESIADFAIAGISYALFRRSKRNGVTMLLVIMLYAVARFLLEFLRGDIERGFILSNKISTSQFISILIAAAAFGLTFYLLSKRKAQDRE